MSKSQSFLEDIHDYLMKCDNQKLCRLLSKTMYDDVSGRDLFQIELQIKESFEQNLKFNDELERSYLVEHIVTAIESNNDKIKHGQSIKLEQSGKFILDVEDIQNDFLKDFLMNFDFMITKLSPMEIREFYSDIDVVKDKSKLKDLILSDSSSVTLKSDGLYHTDLNGDVNKLNKDNLDRFKEIISNISSIQKTREKTAEVTL